MNTVLTQLVPTTEILTCNSRESTFTKMKLLEVDMYLEQYLWISNQVLWTLSELDHSDNSSDQTTSSSDKVVLETTGPRVTILKVLN